MLECSRITTYTWLCQMEPSLVDKFLSAARLEPFNEGLVAGAARGAKNVVDTGAHGLAWAADTLKRKFGILHSQDMSVTWLLKMVTQRQKLKLPLPKPTLLYKLESKK